MNAYRIFKGKHNNTCNILNVDNVKMYNPHNYYKNDLRKYVLLQTAENSYVENLER